MKIGKFLKQSKTFFLGILCATGIGLGISTLETQAATEFPTAWKIGAIQTVGNYQEQMGWRIEGYNADGSANVTIYDRAIGLNGVKNYFTANTLVYDSFNNGAKQHIGTIYTDQRLWTDSQYTYKKTFTLSVGNHVITTYGDIYDPDHTLTNVNISFSLNVPSPIFENNVTHWLGGLKYGEGNNGAKNMYSFSSSTYKGTGGQTVLLSDTSAKLPKGTSLTSMWSANYVSGGQTWSAFPSAITQKMYVTNFEYYYYPTDYSISYNLNGGYWTSGTSAPTKYNVLYGATLPTPKRTGYIFAGWKDNSTGSVVSGYNQNTNNWFSSASDMYNKLNARTTGNKSVTAQWTPIKYTITYNKNGGTGSMGVQTLTYDVASSIKSNGFQRTGYTFQGWNTKADGTGTNYTPGQSVKNLTTTNGANINLYAQWKPITYTIVFEGNGSTSGSMSNLTLTYDQTKTLTKNAYKRTNSDWISWNTQSDGKGRSYANQQSVKNLAQVQGEVIHLYAQWDDIPTLNTEDTLFMQDEVVTIERLIELTGHATDREDGEISDKILINKIKYPDGRVITTPSKDDKLDTSNRTRNDPIEIEYAVTDTFGHTVTSVSKVEIMPKEDPGTDGSGSEGTITENSPDVYDRFIDRGYEDTLEENSIWNTNEEYKTALEEALSKLH